MGPDARNRFAAGGVATSTATGGIEGESMRNPDARSVLALAALLVSAACTGGPASRPRPDQTPSPSRTPASSPTAVAGERPVVAVARGSGALELFRVAADRYEVQRFATVPGPPGAKAVAVSLSAGALPTVCAIWARGEQRTLACHSGGGPGEVVTTGGPALGPLAVSRSGGSIGWLGGTPGRQDLYHAPLTGGRAGPATRIPAFAEPVHADDDAALLVGGVAWSGEETLVVAHGYDTDANGSLAIVPVGRAVAWTDARAVARPDPAYPVLGGAASSSGGPDLLAVKDSAGAFDLPPIAVRLDIDTGRILAVVARALPGRYFESVSGGPAGVLYRTRGDHDVRTYWRRPGDGAGRPLGGLPADANVVVAQP